VFRRLTFRTARAIVVSAASSRTSGAGDIRRLTPPQPPAPFTGLVYEVVCVGTCHLRPTPAKGAEAAPQRPAARLVWFESVQHRPLARHESPAPPLAKRCVVFDNIDDPVLDPVHLAANGICLDAGWLARSVQKCNSPTVTSRPAHSVAHPTVCCGHLGPCKPGRHGVARDPDWSICGSLEHWRTSHHCRCTSSTPFPNFHMARSKLVRAWIEESRKYPPKEPGAAGALRIVKHKGKYFFVDERCRQLRNVDDFMDQIQFASSGELLNFQERECQQIT